MSLQERINLFSNLNISKKWYFFCLRVSTPLFSVQIVKKLPPEKENRWKCMRNTEGSWVRDRELWHPESQANFKDHIARKQGWVILYCVHVPHLLYSFIFQWRSRLLPCPDYCKQCHNERWGICVFFSYGLLRVYAQEWDGWRMLLNHKKQPILVSSTEWIKLQTVIHSEVSQKEKNKYCILMHTYAV